MDATQKYFTCDLEIIFFVLSCSCLVIMLFQFESTRNIIFTFIFSVCPPKCRTCDENHVCCDENCLGGCSGSSNNCTVCRSYSIGDYGDRRCVEECPINLFRVIIIIILL